MILYCVEAWSFPSDEEGGEEEMVYSSEFETKELAKIWVWDRLNEGYQVRLWLR